MKKHEINYVNDTIEKKVRFLVKKNYEDFYLVGLIKRNPSFVYSDLDIVVVLNQNEQDISNFSRLNRFLDDMNECVFKQLSEVCGFATIRQKPLLHFSNAISKPHFYVHLLIYPSPELPVYWENERLIKRICSKMEVLYEFENSLKSIQSAQPIKGQNTVYYPYWSLLYETYILFKVSNVPLYILKKEYAEKILYCVKYLIIEFISNRRAIYQDFSSWELIQLNYKDIFSNTKARLLIEEFLNLRNRVETTNFTFNQKTIMSYFKKVFMFLNLLLSYEKEEQLLNSK